MIKFVDNRIYFDDNVKFNGYKIKFIYEDNKVVGVNLNNGNIHEDINIKFNSNIKFWYGSYGLDVSKLEEIYLKIDCQRIFTIHVKQFRMFKMLQELLYYLYMDSVTYTECTNVDKEVCGDKGVFKPDNVIKYTIYSPSYTFVLYFNNRSELINIVNYTKFVA